MKTWDVVGDAVKQGARVLVWPRRSGREVAAGSTLRDVDGNHVTLEVRWAGVGGGRKEDQELLEASQDSNVGEVEAALSRGANVNNTLGEFGTHRAADRGHVAVAQVLSAAGADLNAKDDYDYTPLHWAAFKGRVEVAQVLVAAGADLNARDRNARQVRQTSPP